MYFNKVRCEKLKVSMETVDMIKFYKMLEFDVFYSNLELNSNDIKIIKDQDLYQYLIHKGYYLNLSKSEIELNLLKSAAIYEVFKLAAVDIAKVLDQNSIDYRLLKGLSVAESYPMPHTRIMGDIDILVKNDELNLAISALESIGYVKLYKYNGVKDITFYKVGYPTIELHFDIFQTECKELYFEYNDLLEKLLKSKSNLKINDYFIKVPDPITHLKYQMLHFFKHFSISGCGVRFILDIKHYMNYYNIDFDPLEAYFTRGQMKLFIELIKNMLILNFRYYDIENLKLTKDEINKVQIAAEYLLIDGVFGKSDDNFSNNNRTLYYEKSLDKSLIVFFRNAFFPNKSQLSNRYKYLINAPYLLPLAWIQRITSFIFKIEPLKSKFYFLNMNRNLITSKKQALKYLGFVKRGANL